MSTDMISSSMDASGYYQYEIAATRMLAGNPDEVRPRLAEALERLGFHVVEERPLIAQRRTKGWGAAGCTINVVECPATVHVKIKEAGAGASLVTFTYTLKTMALSKGDRRVLSHEVDALVALARSRTGSGQCGRCATDVPDDSRFCRRCGAPVAAAEPAEVDLFRLAATTSNGYHHALMGVTLVVVACLLLAVTFMPLAINPAKVAKVVHILTWFAAIAAGGGLALLGLALQRLRKGLRGVSEDREPDRSTLYVPPQARFAPAQLAAPPAPMSVTEGTTSLLESESHPAAREADVRVRHTA
jgi:hypothetical protein